MNLSEVALGLVILWIVLVISFMIFLMRRYTFGKHWTVENPNPYQDETLGIPRGVLRSVLTLSILFVVMLLEVNNLSFDPKDLAIGEKMFIPEDRFEKLMISFQMVIAFYFGSKVMHHVTQAERKVAEKKAQTSVEEAKLKASAPGQVEFEDEGARG